MMLNGSTTFWAVVSAAAAAISGLLALQMGHSSEPLPHSDAASETFVTDIAVRLERVTVEVEATKASVSELRTEQQEATAQILRAIERQ